ncbi:MAG: EthD domain-containing protein [Chthoniobacterales bacterium]
MIKLIVAIKRNPAMTPAEFHDYWRTHHAAKVRALAASRLIRRYVQAHTLESEYVTGEPAFDGTAELWFDTVADKDAFYSDLEYLAKVAPDEKVFADMTRTLFFLTAEEEVIG